jgi:predicted Fe-Mo cluster-binding NifX family protein
MKIAVTSTGPELSSEVDPRFGRSRWFIVTDPEKGEFDVIDNSAGVSAGSGAGVQAAERVARAGAEYLLTGHCGPNAFRALSQAGVKVVTGVDGTVREAIDRLQAGVYETAAGADVEAHHR